MPIVQFMKTLVLLDVPGMAIVPISPCPSRLLKIPHKHLTWHNDLYLAPKFFFFFFFFFGDKFSSLGDPKNLGSGWDRWSFAGSTLVLPVPLVM